MSMYEHEPEHEPTDEDLVTDDYVKFYRFNMNRPPAFVVPDGDEWQDHAKAYMEKTEYWPDVWLAEERGGFRNITTEGP